MADEPKQHWIEVRMLAREVEVRELVVGDRVWYFLAREHKKRKLSRPPAYGPFEVVGLDPFRMKNLGGVEFSFDPAVLVLLVPATP